MVVRLSIPDKGRTCRGTLERLVDIGCFNPQIAERISEVLVEDKARIKEQAKSGDFSPARDVSVPSDVAEYLHIQPDMVREGYPARIMFNMAESTTPDGVPLLIRGISHDYAPQELKSHKTDIAVCGWDEFYASLIYELDEKAQHLGKWPGFNRLVKHNSQEGDSVRVKDYQRTNTKVAGSLGLGDFVGHFFIFPEDKKQELLDREGNITLGDIDKIYIDPKFTALYKAILGRHNHFLYDRPHVLFPEGTEVELVDVGNVEDACMANRGVGVEIVQTGSTLRKHGLVMVSLPLLQSETIIAHTTLRDDVQRVLGQLKPLRYDAGERVGLYQVWYSQLEGNLGANWLNKPPLNQMNIDKKDCVTWVLSCQR